MSLSRSTTTAAAAEDDDEGEELLKPASSQKNNIPERVNERNTTMDGEVVNTLN